MPRFFSGINGIIFRKKLPKIVPSHVAVIMDGNGRWARNKGLNRIEGHKAGIKSVRSIIRYAIEAGVKNLTIYTFSSDNWKRPQEETSGIMKLIEDSLMRDLPELKEAGVKLCALGDLSAIPASTRAAFEEAYEQTKENVKISLYVAVNYSGRNEILNAAKKLAVKFSTNEISLDEITEEALTNNLYAPELPFPELLIRSGGELRVSNFLLWQIAYTEIWVTKVLWPDFKRKHFREALDDFSNRSRRYGGLDPL